MSTTHKIACYDRWLSIADELWSFKLDPSLRRLGLDTTLPVPHVSGLYVRAEYKTPQAGMKYLWVVSISMGEPEDDQTAASASVTPAIPSAKSIGDRDLESRRLVSVDTGVSFEIAYQLATTRFLGLYLQHEARERKKILFERAIQSGLAKDRDWISICRDGRVRICGTYEKAKELDGQQPGWFCRQWLASKAM